MSTQTRTSGGGRNQKKSHSTSGASGGDSGTHASAKKADAVKTDKQEKIHQKQQPTPEQLRIAQIMNTPEDPHMGEKVATLIEMTERSEEEVCCALHECDYNLDRAVIFLLETLPVGAFETSSKRKKKQAASAVQENAANDGDCNDASTMNAHSDRREKSRNRTSNRGGRGGTDSRGWRGREARENERNLRESRGDRGNDERIGGGGGGSSEYRGRGGGGGRGGGRGGGYVGRGGRGGRMGTGGGGRGSDRRGGERSGGYGGRPAVNDEHQEVELWDNTIATNAEKQLNQSHDDAWGDWDNEEYVGSLKDSKVFTASTATNQTAASIVSGGGGGVANDLPAPPGLEQQLGAGAGGTTSSGLSDDGGAPSAATTPIMQYSAAVTGNAPRQTQSPSNAVAASPQYSSAVTESYSSAAASGLAQQQQQQAAAAAASQLKSSATLSAEQSQYFNSLGTQNAVSGAAPVPTGGSGIVQPQQTYAQSAGGGAVQYTTTYANVFGSATGAAGEQAPLPGSGGGVGPQPTQVRRARAKLPPPSKIPSTAVEMPGDAQYNIGCLDVQFGGLDFGGDDTFESLSDKFSSAVSIDGQQQQQSVASTQDGSNSIGTNDYQSKAARYVQQSAVALAALQGGDALSAAGGGGGGGGGFVQRSGTQGGQQQVATSVSGGGGNALDQLKNDAYQTNAGVATGGGGGYPNAYQTGGTTVTKAAANAYQQAAVNQGYNSGSYANSSVANSYQPQSYAAAYQQNSVNSYQQQQMQQQQQQTVNAVQNASNSVGGGSAAQNIPVGGVNSGSVSNANANSGGGGGYLSSSYGGGQQTGYQSGQSVYGNTGFAGSTSATSASQYSGFGSSSKLKDASSAGSGTSHYDSGSNVSGTASASNAVTGGSPGGAVSNANNSSGVSVNNNNTSVSGGGGGSANSSGVNASNSGGSATSNNNNNNSNATNSGSGVSGASVVAASSAVSATSASSSSSAVVAAIKSGSSAAAAAAGSAGGGATGAGGSGGMVPNIQMVSQYIQAGMPYYQQPVYSFEDLQMMQQRVPHVQGYYDLNYTPTSLGAGRDNLGSVAYSTMTDGRFARTDNNSSPVSNVSNTMSQQAGSGGPMLNVPYAYFYGGNVVPGGFQYGTPTLYPQIPPTNAASGGQFPKPSYNAAYGSTNYDTLSQSAQDYGKGAYPSSVNQQSKSQNVTNPPQAGTGSDITSSMYGKGHVALNKVNSYEKQNFHSGTPPPFNMPNTQTAGGSTAQPYSMYLPMPAAGHHNMIHQTIHQDSNSTGQRQQTSNQSKSGNKQAYSPSYWTGQN